jgi:hypothetical protein
MMRCAMDFSFSLERTRRGTAPSYAELAAGRRTSALPRQRVNARVGRESLPIELELLPRRVAERADPGSTHV